MENDAEKGASERSYPYSYSLAQGVFPLPRGRNSRPLGQLHSLYWLP